jgi:P2 family phage contractile tail tube protein
MGRVAVNRVTNANVYLNGVSLLGMAEEVTVGRPKAKMTDHKGLGMVGNVEFPAGLEKVEFKIKWASFYPTPELQLGSPWRVNSYQVRANVETYGPTGLVAQVPLIWLLTGATKEFGDVNLKKHESADFTTVFAAYYFKEILNGVEIMEYDVLANIFVVDGVDQLEQFRNNLGDGLGGLIAATVGF